MSSSTPNETLGQMAELLGDEATREIVRLFLDDFPSAYHRLQVAPREEQVRIVHSLKSSALHMGAVQLSERVAAFEDRLGHGGLALATGDMAALQADFDAVAPALRAYAGP